VARRYVTLLLRLQTAQGQPLVPSALRVQLTMVGMPLMPVPRVVLHPLGPGRYTARVLFVMGGAWEAVVQVRAGRRQAALDLPFRVGA